MRVIWKDEEGDVCDSWDCHLLDAAKEGAQWLAAKDMPESAAQLEQALSHLCDSPTASSRTVGLCTATMNRLWQLRVALPLNLLQGWPHRGWAHFHVVNCSSDDGT